MNAKLHFLKLPDGYPNNSIFDKKWLLHDSKLDIHLGDVIHFPEFITCAGDFEGTYYAISVDSGVVTLWPSDVESPTFPPFLLEMVSNRGTTLRDYYEVALAGILGQTPQDTFGIGDAANSFWGANNLVDFSEHETTGEWHFEGIPYTSSHNFNTVDS